MKKNNNTAGASDVPGNSIDSLTAGVPPRISNNDVDKESGRKRKGASVEVRPLEIDDLAAVFHLGEKLFKAEELPNLYRTWDEYEVAAFFIEDSEFCLVAEIKDRIVGFALGTTIEKTRSSWKYGHLAWLGVDPAYQGQGVGEKLFAHFRDLMEKSKVSILVVDSELDNVAALRFFRKMGFGRPEEHIYLHLNLAPRRTDAVKKPKPA